MSKFETGKERKRVKSSDFYFALKSQNEIYYQMASVFNVVSKDDDALAKKIFSNVLAGHPSKIFLEKLM